MPRSLKSIHWENIRGVRAVTALVTGTALGAGLFPIAPGTMGTIVAIPVVYFTGGWDIWLRIALWVGIFLCGVWAAKVCDEVLGANDHSSIVIDEVVGFGITAWTAGTHFATLLAAFILFRALDILKPPPVRQVDRWSKKAAQTGKYGRWWGGFGVMADDVLAGLQALLLVMLLQYFGFLPY